MMFHSDLGFTTFPKLCFSHYDSFVSQIGLFCNPIVTEAKFVCADSLYICDTNTFFLKHLLEKLTLKLNVSCKSFSCLQMTIEVLMLIKLRPRQQLT